MLEQKFLKKIRFRKSRLCVSCLDLVTDWKQANHAKQTMIFINIFQYFVMGHESPKQIIS